MPKPKKPVTPVAPKPPDPVQAPAAPPPPAPATDARPVIYPALTIEEYSTASPKGPITVTWMRNALGWETESQFQDRKVKEEHAKGNAGAKKEHYLFGDNFHCRMIARTATGFGCTGEKVRCWRNAHNRPLNEDWALEIADMVLHGQYAGPHTIPEKVERVYGGSKPYTMPDGTVLQPGQKFVMNVGTVNAETIRISQYGDILSAQHQGTGLMFAAEMLRLAREAGVDNPTAPRYPVWTKHAEPFIESVVAKGVSEDHRVLMTVDYVRPRSAADVFYTSDVFRDSLQVERNELCRMLSAATDLLWGRTDTRGYKTHPEIVAFLERHKRLLDCVAHLYGENSAKADRKIAKLRLSAGNGAALMYLMAASATTADDSDVYRNMEPAPSEKGIDFERWGRAEEFWTLLAGGADFEKVRDALDRLKDSSPTHPTNVGKGGTSAEKTSLLAKAWERWAEHPDEAGPPFDDDDLKKGGQLTLQYSDTTAPDKDGNTKKLPPGEIVLIPTDDFKGIDCPDAAKEKVARTQPPEMELTKEEIEEARESAARRHEVQYQCLACKGKGCDKCHGTGRKDG